MSSSALDTSIVIRHLRMVDPKIAETLRSASELYLPLTALGEILYGLRRSGDDPRATEPWARFSQNVVLLRPDESTAAFYGVMKNHLASKGKLIPDNDIGIAATARSHDLPLYCRDQHFEELTGLLTIIQETTG